jgi:purine-binding chemotaxis protein CheW
VTQPLAENEVLQFVSFIVEDSLYGLDIRVVKEINPNVSISAVPHTPPHLRGLVNIRGQVVLVIDIAVVLGRDPRPITSDSHIVILKTASELKRADAMLSGEEIARFGDKPTAFLVDRIRDVVTVQATHVEATPPHLGEANARLFDGVIRLGEEVQVLLDAKELL